MISNPTQCSVSNTHVTEVNACGTITFSLSVLLTETDDLTVTEIYAACATLTYRLFSSESK